MSATGNLKDFTARGTLQKNQINSTIDLIWDTLAINWCTVVLKLGNAEITLPTLVTMPLMYKCRIRSIMYNMSLISYILLLTGVTWPFPYKPSALFIQDIQ